MLVVLVAVGAIVYFYVDVHIQQSRAKTIKTTGQPTMGSPSAPVHLIVFEEPYCSACKVFAESVTPAVVKRFVADGQVVLTTIPVSFLPHSMPLAEAWISVYRQHPSKMSSDLFFTFAAYSYAHQPAESTALTTAQIASLAQKASPKIDIGLLTENINNRTYRSLIEDNTRYAKELLGGRLATPAVFINGVLVNDVSLNNIMTEIHEQLAEYHDKGRDR